jgi:hypothetical protein
MMAAKVNWVQGVGVNGVRVPNVPKCFHDRASPVSDRMVTPRRQSPRATRAKRRPVGRNANEFQKRPTRRIYGSQASLIGSCSTPRGEQGWEHSSELPQYDATSRDMPSEALEPLQAKAPQMRGGPRFQPRKTQRVQRWTPLLAGRSCTATDSLSSAPCMAFDVTAHAILQQYD